MFCCWATCQDRLGWPAWQGCCSGRGGTQNDPCGSPSARFAPAHVVQSSLSCFFIWINSGWYLDWLALSVLSRDHSTTIAASSFICSRLQIKTFEILLKKTFGVVDDFFEIYKEYYLLRWCLGDLKVWQIQLILEPLGNGGPGGGRRSMGKGDGLHPGWSG